MKIDLYMLAESFDYRSNSDGESLTGCLLNLQRVSEKARSNDELISIPPSLYEQEIEPNVQLVNWLWPTDSTGTGQDERSLLLQIIENGQHVDEEQYDNVLLDFLNDKPINYTALVCLYKLLNICSIATLNIRYDRDWLEAHRYYLSQTEKLTDFISGMSICFPNLYFSDSVYHGMRVFKPFSRFRVEIINHLSVLNDDARKLFTEYGEDEALKHLNKDIFCSGQGDPAYARKNLCFVFVNDVGANENVVCSPHTKLFYKHSDYRIYFSWGKPSVQGGEKLLVGYIGEHK